MILRKNSGVTMRFAVLFMSLVFGIASACAETSPLILFAVPTTVITGWKLKKRIQSAYLIANEAHKKAHQSAKEAVAENQEVKRDESIADLTHLEFLLSKEFPCKATVITVAVNALLWWWFYKDQLSLPERKKKREEEDRLQEQKRAEDKRKHDAKQAEWRAAEELRRAERAVEEQKRKEKREQREREEATQKAEESRVRDLKLSLNELGKQTFPATYAYQSYGKRMSWTFAEWVATGCPIDNTFLKKHFENIWCMLEGDALKIMVDSGGQFGVSATAEQLTAYRDFGLKALEQQHAPQEQIKYFERICQALLVLQKDDVTDSARGATQTRKNKALEIITAQSKAGKFTLPRIEGDQVFVDAYDSEEAAHAALARD